MTGYLSFASVGLLAATLACNAIASEVKQSNITFAGNAYQYQFTIELDAPIDVVRDIVTDYENLVRINDDVVKSEILERYDERRLKRRMWLNHCIFVFCFDLYFVEDVEDLDDGDDHDHGYPRRKQLPDWLFEMAYRCCFGHGNPDIG